MAVHACVRRLWERRPTRGTWKIFFTDVVMGMARSEMVLTLAAPIYVDDISLIVASCSGWSTARAPRLPLSCGC